MPLPVRPILGILCLHVWAGLGAESDPALLPVSVVQPEASHAGRQAGLPEFPEMTPGSYLGLLHAQNAARASHATEGYLSGVLDDTGVFTGRLLIEGWAQPIGAIFMSDGVAMFAGNVSWLAFGDRVLTLRMEKVGIKVRVTRRGAASEGVLERAEYNHDEPVPQSLLGEGDERLYPICLPSMGEVMGGDRIQPAKAVSSGRLQILRNGEVYLVGVLDDGTLITCTSALLPGNRAPFYFDVPPRAGRALGAFSGVLDFDELETADAAGANVLYFHPARKAR